MRGFAVLVIVVALCGTGSQGVAQMPPQSAAKSGGVEGDTTGAVGALGSGDDHNGIKTDRAVKVPRLGGEGSHPVEGPPPGTTGR